MAEFRILPSDIPMIDPATGKWTSDGYDVMKGLERLLDQLKLTDLADFDNSTPATNGQVPVFNLLSGKWKPGAN